MKRFFFSILVMALSITLKAHAFTIDLTPSSQQLFVGDNLTLNVQVSGLNNASAPSLGDYDLNLNYDANLFSVDNILWGDSIQGNQLDLNGFGSLQSSDNSIAGLINLFELSFDSVGDLNNLQADNFTLFSVMFSSLHTGTANFSLAINALGDAYGNNLIADSINTVSVDIKHVAVPEPSGLLIIIGLIALGISRNKDRLNN